MEKGVLGLGAENKYVFVLHPPLSDPCQLMKIEWRSVRVCVCVSVHMSVFTWVDQAFCQSFQGQELHPCWENCVCVCVCVYVCVCVHACVCVCF